MDAAAPTVEVRNLRKEFRAPGGGRLVAVDDVSFAIRRSEAFGLAGLSGSGKSTVGRIIMNLNQPTSGEVLFEGRLLSGPGARLAAATRSKMQMVFQNPV